MQAAGSWLQPFPILSALKLIVILSYDHGGARVKRKDQNTRADKVGQRKEPGSVLSLRSPPKLSAFLTDQSPTSLIHSREKHI